MTPPDDIRTDNPASESGPGAPAPHPDDKAPPPKRREVGPESEVRGGPEAVDNPPPR